MTEPDEGAGRAAQRRRTRKAIIAAAAQLLAAGRSPSIQEVADAADVSRRTVYMYFPTLEQLLIDASLLAMSRDTVDAALDAMEDETDPEVRIERLARAIQGHATETEQQGRTLMRLTAERGNAEFAEGQPVRGYRRVEWIERAIGPLRKQLRPAEFERLVSALALVIGFEAFVVERDIRALTLEQAVDVTAWSAKALVRAALAQARARTAKARRSARTRK